MNRIKKDPWVVLSAGAVLIAAHVLLIVFQPRGFSAFAFTIISLATAMGAVLLVMNARSANGLMSMRWSLFTAGALLEFLYFATSSYSQFVNKSFPVFNTWSMVLANSSYILGFTMPSEEQRKGERILDFLIAIVYCVIRFSFVHLVVPGFLHRREVAVAQGAVRALLAVLAWKAASGSGADRQFYRAAVFAILASFVMYTVSIETDRRFFAQYIHNSVLLLDTVCFVSVAFCYYYVLVKPNLNTQVKPYRPALTSILPFTITALTVCYSALLMTTHPSLGYSGIAFGIAAFLTRVAFVASHPRPAIVLEESLVREIVSEIAKDPLYGLAARHGLEPALARARSSVSVLTPLSLILFAIEERIDLLDELSEETESPSLVRVARSLNNWRVTDSTICYLGTGRFAMLLPATPLRIAMSLAEQMCLSIDKLDIANEEGPMTIMAGVAVCTEPSRVSNLLYTSSIALERACVDREARVRSTSFTGEALFDA